MDFSIKILAVIEIFGYDVWITETLLSTWIIMSVLIMFAIIVRVKLRAFKEAPSGFQNVVEIMVETFDNFVKTSAGERLRYLGNWYFMVFIFILTSNLSGLVYGMRPPTADWAVTFTFALCTFILIQFAGFRYRGRKYAKSLIEPNPVFLPLNIIGELARPVSLSFRLFGNILAGMILMSMLYSLAPIYLRFFVPSFLHAYFDVVAGVLQTYIFCVLSLSFIGVAAADND